MSDAAEGDEPNKDAAEQLRAFLERDPEWPLLFYEFWSLSVRNPELQGDSLNGLAFERAADPKALPDEVFAESVTAVLGCAISVPSG